jgi:hypothetical protein
MNANQSHSSRSIPEEASVAGNELGYQKKYIADTNKIDSTIIKAILILVWLPIMYAPHRQKTVKIYA